MNLFGVRSGTVAALRGALPASCQIGHRVTRHCATVQYGFAEPGCIHGETRSEGLAFAAPYAANRQAGTHANACAPMLRGAETAGLPRLGFAATHSWRDNAQAPLPVAVRRSSDQGMNARGTAMNGSAHGQQREHGACAAGAVLHCIAGYFSRPAFLASSRYCLLRLARKSGISSRPTSTRS